jgi:hypothetical protein
MAGCSAASAPPCSGAMVIQTTTDSTWMLRRCSSSGRVRAGEAPDAPPGSGIRQQNRRRRQGGQGRPKRRGRQRRLVNQGRQRRRGRQRKLVHRGRQRRRGRQRLLVQQSRLPQQRRQRMTGRPRRQWPLPRTMPPGGPAAQRRTQRCPTSKGSLLRPHRRMPRHLQRLLQLQPLKRWERAASNRAGASGWSAARSSEPNSSILLRRGEQVR